MNFSLALAILMFALDFGAGHSESHWKLCLRKDGGNVVDLTHTVGPRSFVYPAMGANLTHTRIHVAETHDAVFYQAYRFETAEHLATHIDAPKHFKIGGAAIHEIPLTTLMGRAVMVDLVETRGDLRRNYAITVDDYLDWKIRKNLDWDPKIVFFHTGLGKYYGRGEIDKFLSTDDTNNPGTFKHPGVSCELAEMLSDDGVKVVGTDALNIDVANQMRLCAHVILQKNDIVIVENLANLDKLVDHQTGFQVMILPMKLENGSGAPTRIVAIMDVDDE